MPFLTAFLGGRQRGPTPVLVLICLLFVISASGQPSVHLRLPVGAAAADLGEPARVDLGHEEIGWPPVQQILASLEMPEERRKETHPKPHAPIFVVSDPDVQTPTMLAAASRSEQATSRFFTSPQQSNLGPPSQPSWRPFKMPGRFGIAGPDEDEDDTAQNGVSNKFHWKPAIAQSIVIQGFQHTYAIVVQERMRRELKGPFFKDWFESVRGLRGWEDGNKFFTNYVAHPMQGAMTGFIFLQNHDRLKRQKFAESKTYWNDRLKAMLWSAAWSTQWEIGPFSQASIGNVGLDGKGMAYVDLVMTPTAGTGWMVVEEAFDRYIIRHIEKTNFVIKMFARTLLNPMRAVANALRFKEPWYRDRPFGT